jgi:hypothetical protein
MHPGSHHQDHGESGDGEVEYALAAAVLLMAVVLVLLATSLDEAVARLLGF